MAQVSKFDQERKDAIEIIKNHPGITMIDLTKTLADATGHTVSQMRGVVSKLIENNKVAHVQAQQDGAFTYKLYTTLPPGVDPALFVRKGKKAKEEQKEQKELFKPMKPAPEPKPAPVVPASVETGQFDKRYADPAPHPRMKPGAAFIYIETQQGPQAFTLEEARRVYEHLHQFFNR
jgi:hypothetical protein